MSCASSDWEKKKKKRYFLTKVSPGDRPRMALCCAKQMLGFGWHLQDLAVTNLLAVNSSMLQLDAWLPKFASRLRSP